MKVLLVGMDGAHVDVFKRGWTPFISSLIENGTTFDIKNDLVSRGWLEVATGQHASITGAMYDNPKMNGSYEWNLKFSINDIPGINESVKPIWQVLNDNGYRVGVMNLPTVFPSPAVDGFFVSGGGGGAPVVEKAIPELCYPKSILSVLEKNDYIVDERTVQLVIEKKLDTPELIFNELANKNSKRTTSFIELSKGSDVDFGFVVYKTSSVTAETILVPEWKKKVNQDKSVDEETISALKNYYSKFDNEIKRLHEAFPEAKIIFTSDHGTIARTHSVNLNVFLQQYKYQNSKTGFSLRKWAIESLKKIIPFALKVKLQKIKSLKNTVDTVTVFDTTSSIAFSHTKNDWSHGIYINDNERFNGPVESEDVERIKLEIIEAFNADSEVIKHGLRAYSVKENLKQSVGYFPDILVDIPSGYLTNNASDGFIKSFKRPEGVTSLSSVLRGDIISIKSHEPLAVDCSDSSAEGADLYKGRDLTAIYDLVLKKFNIENNKEKSGAKSE
jgi:predicted AlkP superfamily phosphohydrolase/phosphomutase